MYLIKPSLLLFSMCSFLMGLTINLQSGINFSTIEWDVGTSSWYSSYSSARKPGPTFLLGAEYLDRGALNLSSNIGIVRKAGSVATKWGSNPIYYVDGISYLTVNTTVDYKIMKWKKIKPFISLGPRLDFVIHKDPIFDEIPQFNNYAFGMIFGGGIKFIMNKVVLGFRYDFYQNSTGIAEWEETNKHDRGDVLDKTTVLSLVVGYKIRY